MDAGNKTYKVYERAAACSAKLPFLALLLTTVFILSESRESQTRHIACVAIIANRVESNYGKELCVSETVR